MSCTQCGGRLEFTNDGKHGRCLQCMRLFSVDGGYLTLIHVEAPGGGHNPEFNAIFATQLGFGPPGTNPTSPPAQGGGMPDVGVRVHVPGFSSIDIGTKGVSVDEGKLKGNIEKKVKDKLWGLVFGAAIIGVMLLVLLGVGIYVAVTWNSGPGGSSVRAVKWDGKSTYECSSGNVKIEGTTANVPGTGVRASGNCVLTLTGVSITSPVGIDASGNAKVTMTGGAITSTTNAVVAGGNATVTVSGAAVSGKAKTSANGKVVGVPTK